MQSVLDKITANDARNCFRHCGYTLRVEWDCSSASPQVEHADLGVCFGVLCRFARLPKAEHTNFIWLGWHGTRA